MNHKGLFFKGGLSAAVFCLGSAAVFAGTYSGGNGLTPETAFLISTPDDLLELSDPTNAGDWDKHFLMTNDIDMSGIEGFTPISPDGDPNNPSYTGTGFKGVFDGGGYVISDLAIGRSIHHNIGLWGYIDSGGVVRNLRLNRVTVTGYSNVGGLVGYVADGEIESCSVTGTVNGRDDNIGGLAGNHLGTITSSLASCSVNGTDQIGGLVGRMRGGSVNSCYSTGTVTGDDSIGGLVGDLESGRVRWSYSTGMVTGDEDVGGLLGKEGNGEVVSSVWDLDSSGVRGGAGGKGLTTPQIQTPSIIGNMGWSGDIWEMQAGEYPRLAWENTGSLPVPAPEPLPFAGDGTKTSPYLISTAEEVDALSFRPEILDDPDIHLALTNDINCSGRMLGPIGELGVPFEGHFDGRGFEIQNFEIDLPRSKSVGFFNVLLYNSEVINLGLVGGTVTGRRWVGGMAGSVSDGYIASCRLSLTVSGEIYVGGLVGWAYRGHFETCEVQGAVTGYNHVGGLVGWSNDGFISSCSTDIAISAGDVVGGVVGRHMGGTVEMCYATGTVNGDQVVGGLIGHCDEGPISQCYSACEVTGNSEVGGLFGTAHASPITASFWDIDTSGTTVSDGGVGVGTLAMQTQSTFENAGWDFSNSWFIPADSYPVFPWQMPTATILLDYLLGEMIPPMHLDINDDGIIDIGDFIALANG